MFPFINGAPPAWAGLVGLECVFLEEFGELVGVYLVIIGVAVHVADVAEVFRGSVGVPVAVILSAVLKIVDDVVLCGAEVDVFVLSLVGNYIIYYC